MLMSELLRPEAVIAPLRVGSKKQALQELSKRASADTGLSERAIFDVLLERERLGSTGLGNGIAVPHGKPAEATGIYALFAKLSTPVDFDAVDDAPVDLVFLLLAPEGAGADHLKALARISRTLRDRSLCEKIRGSDTAEAIWSLLSQHSESHAA